jgi:hypothetical protein
MLTEKKIVNVTKYIVAMVLLLLPATVQAQQESLGFEPGDWELTLAGTGTNDEDFDNSVLSISLAIGYFFSPSLESGIRQDYAYFDTAGTDDKYNAATQLFLDYHVDLDRVQPFAGISVGGVYGDFIKDQFIASPEIGLKVFVNSTTFILALMQYQILFDEPDDIDDEYEDGRMFYQVGIGFRF